MDMNQYLEIFIEETREHLQGLNQNLLVLERNPGEIAVLNEIFRVAHTLKGMSGTMGFTRMAGLTHTMEDVLQALRSGEIKVNTRLVDILFKCLDALESYLTSIVNAGSEGSCDNKDIISALKSIRNNDFQKAEAVTAAEVDEVIVRKLDANLSDSETQQESSEKGDVHESEDNHADDDKASAHIVKSKTGKTVRVDIERLDVLMNLVSELIIIKTRLDGVGSSENTQNYNEAVEDLERTITQLNDAVMKVRMVPVETVFNRFPRTIRDMCRTLGKDVGLVMTGEETELDRTVIDEIGEPLIHLLRNSIDHGIEAKEKRLEAGKPAKGKIALKAYQDGNNVIIVVEDDGEGINVEKIKQKAIEKGLVSRDIAETLSIKDIMEFMFRPSFSTVDKVTDYSGRGVGLDVVKTKIEALGGAVEVESEKGKGSRFIIRLPLTLAIIQALLVMVGNEKYAVPLGSIQEILYVKPEEIKLVQKQEVMFYRKSVLPVIRLDKVLDIEMEQENVKNYTVVVVKKGEKLSGLIIDNYIGQQEIVIKSLGSLMVGIRYLAGATILGDGNVALILDINSLC